MNSRTGAERAKAFLGETLCIHIVVSSWCGEDFVREQASRCKYYDLDGTRLVAFVEMSRAAKSAADRVVIIGPGSADTWVLSCMALYLPLPSA